jgi:hypothetical protein
MFKDTFFFSMNDDSDTLNETPIRGRNLENVHRPEHLLKEQKDQLSNRYP